MIGLTGGLLFFTHKKPPATSSQPAPIAAHLDSTPKTPNTADLKDIHSTEPSSPAQPEEARAAADPELTPLQPPPLMDRRSLRPEPAPRPGPAPVPGRLPPPEAQPVEISVPDAREALGYVGADPIAEAVWAMAINNPDMPPKVRKDLIEDLNEEGFPDPKHITPDDLPLIWSRLLLIEQHAPEAMDEVNAAAFMEAYKDLVKMFLRVTQE